MLKTKQIKLKDSNMANYGSKEHKEMRKKVSQKEKAWANIGKKKGLQIWRIEKFKVKSWPKNQYGQFYGGDSYIILHTMEDDEGKKSYDVYFWLGAETSQDEAGTAAYKTVELDDYLGDEPVQYREVQGNESKAFLDLFPKMTVLSGGVDSGFHKVKPKDYKPRLLHITGFKKHVQVDQVEIKASSLNDSDTFVLDAGLKIYSYHGTYSSSWEKRKANAIVDELESARFGKVKDTYIIDGLKDKGNKMIEEFWEYFGGRPKSLPKEAKSKSTKKVVTVLLKVSDDSGQLEVTEVAKGKKIDKSQLEDDDAFILDAGGKLYIWIGKKAKKSEKKEAYRYAVEYLKGQGRSNTIPMCRVSQGKETKAFWEAMKGKQEAGRAFSGKKWKKEK